MHQRCILGIKYHSLLCSSQSWDRLFITTVFSWVVRPLSVTMAKSRLPDKEKAGESMVETLSARQDNLLGWSLGPLLWHFMERQPVVMGLRGTHNPCLAFVLLPSLGCLIIYPWYDNLPHDLFRKQRRGEAAGKKDWRGMQLSISTNSPVMALVRNHRKMTFVLLLQLFTQRTQ